MWHDKKGTDKMSPDQTLFKNSFRIYLFIICVISICRYHFRSTDEDHFYDLTLHELVLAVARKCTRIRIDPASDFFEAVLKEFQLERNELKANTEKILTANLKDPLAITNLWNELARISLNFDKLVSADTCRLIPFKSVFLDKNIQKWRKSQKVKVKQKALQCKQSKMVIKGG